MNFDQIANFALKSDNIPEPVLEATALLLIDTIGVAAGAANMDAGRIARDHSFAFHGSGDPANAAHMMFDGRPVSIPGAGFAAATQIDNLDAHDGYNPTKGHIGCAVVPALFAFAEANPDLSGRDALKALAMSYEVAARAGIALHETVSDYHTSGAWNALGVAALGCRLRGATTNQLRHAFGIAEYHGPRSQMMREIANPTMLHDGSGMGALVGSMATLMAENGFLGAPAVTVEDHDIAPHWSTLGADWTVTKNYIKPYPICRWAHAAIDALSGLMQTHEFKVQDVSAIDVNTFEQAAALYPDMPETASQAQYSLRFSLAVMLAYGQIGPSHITGAGLKDPKIADVLPLISITEDNRHSSRFPAGRWSDVSVTLKNGTILNSGDIHARGGPESPMNMTELEAKFRAMAAVLPEARQTAIWGMKDRLLDPTVKFEDLACLVRAPVEGNHV